MTSLPQRQSTRLQGYDYTQSGAYFVTICTYQRIHLFGHIRDDKMKLSPAGEIASRLWRAIPRHFPQIELDAFVVMPNHVHGIVVNLGATDRSPAHKTQQGGSQSGSLGAVIGQYKSSVTRHLRKLPNAVNHPIWQRNYHDRIIRNEREYNYIREYMLTNPARWAADVFYGTVQSPAHKPDDTR